MHPIEPEEYIPVENIRGKLLLIGAEDDALWDTAKYIRRMKSALRKSRMNARLKQWLCSRHPLCLSGGDAENHAAGWLRSVLKLAFQAAKEISQRMPPDPIDIGSG